MGVVSLLVLSLIIRFGLKVDRIVIVYTLLGLSVLVSAFLNSTSILKTFLFFRTLVFSFLIYYLVEIYLTKINHLKIIRWCLLIGIFQLPILLLQRAVYDRLPARLTALVSRTDFDFGTFNFKGDAAMSFFLTLLIIYLLFNYKHTRITRYRWTLILWFSLTVIISNAEIVKLILASVWGVYLLKNMNKRASIYTLGILLLIFAILIVTGVGTELWTDLTTSLANNTKFDLSSTDAFLSGDYARGTAIAYYLDQGLSWFGDGPSENYNPITRTRFLGNTGHIFTFYSEIGFVGWLLSVLIFFLLAFPIRNWRVRIGYVNIFTFIAIQILGFTSQIMNDISVVLIYAIILKSYQLTFTIDGDQSGFA